MINATLDCFLLAFSVFSAFLEKAVLKENLWVHVASEWKKLLTKTLLCNNGILHLTPKLPQYHVKPFGASRSNSKHTHQIKLI